MITSPSYILTAILFAPSLYRPLSTLLPSFVLFSFPSLSSAAQHCPVECSVKRSILFYSVVLCSVPCSVVICFAALHPWAWIRNQVRDPGMGSNSAFSSCSQHAFHFLRYTALRRYVALYRIERSWTFLPSCSSSRVATRH